MKLKFQRTNIEIELLRAYTNGHIVESSYYCLFTYIHLFNKKNQNILHPDLHRYIEYHCPQLGKPYVYTDTNKQNNKYFSKCVLVQSRLKLSENILFNSILI